MPLGQAPTSDIGVPDLLWATDSWAPIGDWWETSADLLWPQSVITYGRMRHDPQIRAVLNAYALPILRANWAVDPDGCKDAVAKHVADDLGVTVLGEDAKPGPARRRGIIWRRHLRLALDHLVYGHLPFELRYRLDGTSPGDAHLDHLGERLPWTIAAMNVNKDGTLRGIKQNTQDQEVPANRLLWYVTGQAGANWAGTSILRPAYGPWLLKHEMWRVHGTSIRRWGMGVPGVEAPAGATAQQVAQAQEMASAMRGGDQAGMGVPAGFRPFVMGMTGSAPDALAFIEYLDRAIAKMALAGLIELGQTETGSRALGETFLDLFLLSLQAVADELATTATSGQDGMPGAVVDLVTVNWGEDEPAPRLVCTDVGNNYQLAADSLQALMAAGAITADPNLEKWVRETWRLPERDVNAAPPVGSPASPGGSARRAVPGESPPAPGQLPAGPPRPALPPGGQVAAAAPPGPGHGAVEAAGFDAAAHDQAWLSALDALTGVYRDVLRAQRADIADSVIAAVAKGKPEDAAAAQPDIDQGSAVIRSAMVIAARHAAAEVTGEAAHQGVTIDPARIHVDEAAVGRAARMWAQVIAQRMVSAAAVRAASAMATAPMRPQADDVGSAVEAALGELSDARLREELGAAISAAQNAGRMAAFAAAEHAGQVSYVATEVLDRNTCEPCKAADGAVFGSLTQAQMAYPAGHYAGCLGQLRCRGTVVALWAPEAGQVAAAAWAASAMVTASLAAARALWEEAKHPRRGKGAGGGEFTHAPGEGGTERTSGAMKVGEWHGGYQAVAPAPVHLFGGEHQRAVPVAGQEFRQTVRGSYSDPWWMTNGQGQWAVSRRWRHKAQTGYDWSGGGRAKTFPIPAADERVLTHVDATGAPLPSEHDTSLGRSADFPALDLAAANAAARSARSGQPHYITPTGDSHWTVSGERPSWGNHFEVDKEGNWSRQAGPGKRYGGGYSPNRVKMDGPPTRAEGNLLSDSHPLNQANAHLTKLDATARAAEQAEQSAHEVYVMALHDSYSPGGGFDPNSPRAQVAEKLRQEWQAAHDAAAKARGAYQAALVKGAP